MNRKLFCIIVYFFLSFLLCCSNSGCLDWLKNLCFKEEQQFLDESITSNISNNDDKINEKEITLENLFIIGDIGKCEEVMKKLGADSWSEGNEITIYNKEIIDDSWNKTFKFYLCGNEVGKCEEIYKRIEQFSYFFFFVDITDSNSLNKLRKLLFDFKQKFKEETLRFFLILLKTDPQEKQMISVKEANEFCEKNELNFFGEIDIENNTWDFEGKRSFYKALKELSESEEKSDYKIVETKYDDEGFAYFVIKEGNDIWGMFLCGVKREDIIRQLVSDDYKLKRC